MKKILAACLVVMVHFIALGESYFEARFIKATPLSSFQGYYVIEFVKLTQTSDKSITLNELTLKELPPALQKGEVKIKSDKNEQLFQFERQFFIVTGESFTQSYTIDNKTYSLSGKIDNEDCYSPIDDLVFKTITKLDSGDEEEVMRFSSIYLNEYIRLGCSTTTKP